MSENYGKPGNLRVSMQDSVRTGCCKKYMGEYSESNLFSIMRNKNNILKNENTKKGIITRVISPLIGLFYIHVTD